MTFGSLFQRKILDTCSYGTSRLFTIYLGKPVGPRFWQMISKIQDWGILSLNRVYHLYKSVPFTKKRPQRRETGIKDGWMNFCLEDSIRKNRTTFSDVPLLPEIFRWNDPKSRVTYIFQPDFPETFCKMVNSVYVFFFPT